MSRPPPHPARRKPAAPLQPRRKLSLPTWVVEVGILAGFWLYLWLWVEPALHYQAAEPVFLFHTDFFKEFLRFPGGLGEYATAFLLHLHSISGLGAALDTAAAWLLCRALKIYLERIQGQPVRRAHWLPLLAVALWQYPYGHGAVALSIGSLLSAITAAGYAVLPWGRPVARLGALIAGMGVLWLAAGLAPALLAAWWAAAFEWCRGRRRTGMMAGLIGCVLAGGVFFLFAMKPAAAFQRWADRTYWPILAVLAFYPVLTAVVLNAAAAVSPGTGHAAGAGARHRRLSRLRPALPGVGAACLFLAAGAGLYLRFDSVQKRQLQIDFHAGRNQWEAVLQAAKAMPRLTLSGRLNLNLALYRVGRLAEDFFSFPQPPEGDLLPGLEWGLEHCLPLSVTLWELGQVNLAEHYAHEVLEIKGERPEVLELLAKINLVKGRPQAARVFLNLLARTPFYRRRADFYRQLMESDSALAGHAELAGIRSRLVTNDVASSRLSPSLHLRQLLQANPTNRMAFEYLMTHYLVTRQPEAAVQILQRLKAGDYPVLPRHWEEAIIIQQKRSRGAQPILPGRTIREETVRRFAQFEAIIHEHGDDLALAQPHLEKPFGDTYWFYYLYHYAPGKNPAPQHGTRP